MNKINYNQDGGFRVSTNILSAAQAAYSLFNALGWIAGNLTIIQGCEVTGTIVSDGYVFINGEVLPFKGGGLRTNVIIKETVISYPFQNGTVKPVIHERYAGFGTSTPENNYLWTDFVRIFDARDIKTFKDSHNTRITNLEGKQAFAIGMVIRYDQPLSVLPPAGWIDFNPENEQGRVWVARSESDYDFGLGSTGGEKTHLLKTDELPEHDHLQGSEALYNDYGGGSVVGQRSYPNGDRTAYRNQKTSKTGGNLPHNNLQPYVAVRYIKYVGIQE